jgi:hypothetical protein
MNMSIKDKAALGRANTKKEQNKIMKIVQGPDGMMYKVSPDGDMELIETKRSIGPAGASTVSDDGKRMITRAKGGMVKGYMGGGEVHMDDSPNSGMITTKGWGKSRAT